MARPKSTKRVVYEAAGRLAFPCLAPCYRRYPSIFPSWTLETLGIATPLFHRSFLTIVRIVSSIPHFSGAIAECGVWKGESLFGMAHLLRLRGLNVPILGFDSFEGLPEPTAEDSVAGEYQPETERGVFSDTSYESVLRRSSGLGFRNIQLVKGFFENTLEAFGDRTFTLVHLDVDLYKSYRTCLEFFYPRMTPGGYIIFDEYDWTPTYPGAGKAIDEFLSDKPESVQRFPEFGCTGKPFIRRAT